MARVPDHYSRLYWRLADEFPLVYDGPLLAVFVRLLIAADQAWPSSARWGGCGSRKEVGLLAKLDLIFLDGPRYRIRGMDKERRARSDAASYASRSRWRNADSNAEIMPRREEKRKEENITGNKSGNRARASGRDADRRALEHIGSILRAKDT